MSKVTESKISLFRGSDCKVPMTKTITENDGFTTMTITRQYVQDAPMVTTTADIFVRDEDQAKILLGEDMDYKNLYWGYRCRFHSFNSLKEAMNALPRKLQTSDFRGRDLTLILLQWDGGSVSVYQQN